MSLRIRLGLCVVCVVACRSPGTLEPNSNCDLDAAPTWFGDLDGDGYGDPDDVLTACVAPSGYVANDDDCVDDLGNDPDATEICNDLDDDCSGLIDDDPADGVAYYADNDGDGYGDGEPTMYCDGDPSIVGVDNNADCNDNNTSTLPR